MLKISTFVKGGIHPPDYKYTSDAKQIVRLPTRQADDACNSNDKGPAVKKICSAGCIACKICERKFPYAGFTVKDFLSYIDYSVEAVDQDKAAQACPVKCICPTD